MPFFVPQQPPRSLPAKGSAIELAVMDWKVKATGTDFHLAKDVAAFANHLGGAILVGASERSGQLVDYVGMTPGEAGNVRDRFSKAVKDRCQPPPLVDFAEYEHPDDGTKRVVAVNVWPSLQLVGVRVAGNKDKEGYGGDAFTFPLRSGTDAIYLTPVQIPMYMTPHVRRIVVMLSKIPVGAEVHIEIPARNHKYISVLEAVAEEENVARFRSREGTPAQAIPLDCITTVYESWEPNSSRPAWRIYVNYMR